MVLKVILSLWRAVPPAEEEGQGEENRLQESTSETLETDEMTPGEQTRPNSEPPEPADAESTESAVETNGLEQDASDLVESVDLPSS